MKRIKIYMMMLVAALMCGCSDDAPETTTDGLKLEIEVSNITNQTATLTGKVVEGPQNRYTYAFIVSKESFKKYDASSSAQTLYPCDYGKYTLDLTGLEPETTYYVAFYAHNDAGQEAYTFTTFNAEYQGLEGGIWIEEGAEPYAFDFINDGSYMHCHVRQYSDNYNSTNCIADVLVTVTEGGIQSLDSNYSFNLEEQTKNTMKLVFNGKRFNLTRKNLDFADYANFVDLGLPSGTKWMDRDMGAIGKGDYGWEYYFGSIVPYKESTLSGEINIQGTQNDAAYMYNVNWVTPSREDFIELLKYCSVTSNGGVLTIEGPNGNSIKMLRYKGSSYNDIYYLISNPKFSPYGDDCYYSYYLLSNGKLDYNINYQGTSRIRPVMK